MDYFKVNLSLIAVLICFALYNPVRAQSNQSNNPYNNQQSNSGNQSNNSLGNQTYNSSNIPANISSINVNNLTDAQIRNMLQQAQAAGLSDSELIEGLKSKGMTDAQANALQARIANIRNGGANNRDTTQQKARGLNYTPDSLNMPKLPDLATLLKPKIFGADFFRSLNSTFEPNLNVATPLNYVVGPNDQLIVNVYGKSVVNWTLDVTPEGNINIPGVGILNVTGKTIEQATTAIKNKLIANNYAVGNGVSVQVTLGNIRSIKVILVGEVMKPGTYTLPSLATVFNALYSAGGPNDNGSFRQIEIIRNNHIIRKLDVYDFLLKGELKDNIVLQDQDIIHIPPYTTRVEMSGEVKTPALFEVLPGETLQNVINFAGGFTDRAYTARIKVVQVSDQQHKIADVFEKDFNTYKPQRGDKYTIERILDRFENRVLISGAVFRPGEYELKDGLTLSQLIQNAAGLKEDAFMGRGNIIRLKPDNTTESIPFNVQGIMDKSSADIPLKREDSVRISSIFDLRDKYTVTIQGKVRFPGDFSYSDSLNVEDLIMEAGGFLEGASTKRIEVARRIDNSDPQSKGSIISQVFSVDVNDKLKEQDINFALKPYDIVSVYSLPGYEVQSNVKVEGEVIYPGNYTIQKKDERISDILNRAGGLTASADIDGASLKRNNTAILGLDQDKTSSRDSAEIYKEQLAQLKGLQQTFKDTTNLAQAQLRNDFVGINLRQILKDPDSPTNLILEDGDVLRIPKQQQIVKVNGQVLFPSAVIYQKGRSFKEYVLNAGGFGPNAYKKGAYIVYANGTVQGTRKILFFNGHPRVEPGSEIFVPTKPPSTTISLQETLGLTTGLASLGAIILGIISLNK